MKRTIKLLIGHDEALDNTMSVYNQACQQIIDTGWELVSFNKNVLHEYTYRSIRKAFPNLQSSLVQCARDQASDMLKREKFKTKPIKKAFGGIRYNARTFTPKLKEGIVSISTLEGRKKFKVPIPEYFKRYIDWQVKSAQLIRSKDGRFFLYLTMETDAPKAKSDGILGIDVGVNNIAVCSNNTFFNSRHLREVKGRYRFLRAKLQSVGTRSAKRKLKRLARRENRFVTDTNHCISKKIVEMPYGSFAFEKLNIKKRKELGKRFNRKLGGWSYRQLQDFVTYKAEALGKQTIFVNPSYTSRTCSVCSASAKSFRQGNTFRCGKCGLQLNADLNASRNIALLARFQQKQGLVNDPIVAYDEPQTALAELKASIVTSHLTC